MVCLPSPMSRKAKVCGYSSDTFSCVLIWFLVMFILVDVLLYHKSSFQSQLEVSATKALPADLDTQEDYSKSCNTRDAFYEDGLSWARRPHNPWRQTKWVLEPAACRVRGHLIEKLDDSNNFRRGYSLRFADNVEDRTHLLPWLLGSRIDLNRRSRRVYLDLGANTFSSSIQWFLQMYPVDFTEVHAFEILPSVLQQTTLPRASVEQTNWASTSKRQSRRTKKRPGIPAWMLDRIKIYNKFVSDEDNVQKKAVNITRFIKEELRLKAQDTVIVKMDIENSEWKILTRWMHDPQMVGIIDEIFVEMHYNHTSMHEFHWGKFDHTRQQVKRFLADLRWKGLYVHFWP